MHRICQTCFQKLLAEKIFSSNTIVIEAVKMITYIKGLENLYFFGKNKRSGNVLN